MTRPVRMPEDWLEALQEEFDSPYMGELGSFLRGRKAEGAETYPAGGDIFHAFEATPIDRIKVVVIGQDPYHGPGQAHGLSFSVRPGARIPPSLANIYRELDADLGIPPAPHGFLDHWAHEGVLLLNSVLTVERGRAGSHAGRGWERFTDAVVRTVSDRAPPCVFMLWGAYAQRKAARVDGARHLVIRSAHPSFLASQGDFLGSRPFSRANAFLVEKGRGPVDWRLPERPSTERTMDGIPENGD